MAAFSRKITERLDGMTHSQRAVGVYYLENMDSVAFCTLEDIALRIGVSTTTIIRFARSLGYSGYSEMHKDIQSNLIDKVSLPERLVRLQDTASLDQLLVSTMQNDVADITTTLSSIPQETLDKVLNAINTARNVYILGLRSSFSLAHYMTSRLGQLRPNVRLIQSAGMLFPEELVGCNSEDTCIAFLFPRYSKTSANLLLWLKNRNVPIILFTSRNYRAVEGYGDILLPCSVGGVSFKNSFAAPLSLINYLAAGVAIMDNDRAVDTIRQTEEFLSKGYHLGL